MGQVSAKTLKKQMRKNKREIDREIRNIDRDIKSIEKEQERLKAKIRKEAEAGNNENVKATAKQIVRIKNQTMNLNKMKDSMFSVKLQLSGMASMQVMTMTMKNMTRMMTRMNKQMNPQKFARIMAKFEKEAAKAEMTEEMMQDVLGDALGDDQMAEDELVEQVLAEAGLNAAGELMEVPTGEPNRVAQSNKAEPVAEGGPAAANGAEVDDLEARLRNLNRGNDQ